MRQVCFLIKYIIFRNFGTSPFLNMKVAVLVTIFYLSGILFFLCPFLSCLKPSSSTLGKTRGVNGAGVLPGAVRWGMWAHAGLAAETFPDFCVRGKLCIFHHLVNACYWSFYLSGICLVWGYTVDLRRASVIPERFLFSSWDLEWNCRC